MSEPLGRDPLDELRHADPADPDRLPSASLARVRARVQEATVMHETERPAPRRGLAIGAGIVALAVVALGGAVALRPPASEGQAAASVGAGGGGALARCVEQYSLQALKGRDFAFDGTVKAIDGNEVTFTVNEAFRGSDAPEVTLTADGMTGTTITSVGGPTLALGERYLVAGEDRFVWPCGFTQEYDPGVAADWATALGG